MLNSAYMHNGPTTVRYPRGSGVGAAVTQTLEPLPWGKAQIKHSGRQLALLAFGPLLQPALEIGGRLGYTVVDMRWAKPLDLETLRNLAQDHMGLVTLEDGCIAGGAGSAVLEATQAMGLNIPTLLVGFDDGFTEHGDPTELMKQYDLDAKGIEARISRRWPELFAHTQENLHAANV